jgi:ADP-ribose pyrophosphatase YjhB (NUDIX family)
VQESIDLSTPLARWSQSLVGIAQTGLAFTTDPYDTERYEELLRLAAEMAASMNSQAVLDPVLATQLEAGWREQVEIGFKGYVTPKVTVGGIVFNEQDELLLVYTAGRDDWCFPVGLADIGYTPSEVAKKEVLEESGLHVTPIQLMGVADSFARGFNRDVHMYNLLFYCRLDGGELEPRTPEVTEAGFFKREALPEPLNNDGRQWVDDVFDWHWSIRREPYFD